MPKVYIDGTPIEVENGATILDACEKIGVEIPTLCYLKHLNPAGSCRLCLVEVKGSPLLQTACSTPCAEGMEVSTMNKKIYNARKLVLELLLANHNSDCFACPNTGKCDFAKYCMDYDIEQSPFPKNKEFPPIDETSEFFTYDASKCILCRRCVRTCEELQCNNTYTLKGRGHETLVGLPFDQLFKTSNCVSCGNCVSVCPTGALSTKAGKKYRDWEVNKTQTTCPYCGVGCQIELHTKGNKVVGIEPIDVLPNNNLLCVKGKFAYEFINHKDRLKKPMMRKAGKGSPLEEVSWDEAMGHIAEKMLAIKAESGPDSLAGFASARVTNEANYIFMKMMRAAVGTNNVDHCARLCHASTVAGLATTLGSGAMTNSISEVVDSDVILVSGSNTTETHPVIGAKIRQALLRGAKLIVAEPREIDLAKQAEIFLQIKPGTNVAFFNGMMNVVIEENLMDKEYVENKTEGFEELKTLISEYTPEKVAEICNINAEDLRKAARLYAKAEKASLYYSMGVTQHSTGTAGVMCTSNLALLCGQIGKYGGGVNPLRGQNNVQGACDVGCLPGDYTAYQKVVNPDARAKFEKAWGVALPDKPGLTITETIRAIDSGDIRCLYVMGENPMLSDPDINHVEHALKKCEFLVVQDIFLTETAELADVVLPATTYAETNGTFTNTERRVQLVCKAIEPVGDSREDWDIINEMMDRLGYKNNFRSASDILDELASTSPSYGGYSFERLKKEQPQWPCPSKDHPGTPILHVGKFSRGERAIFKPSPYIPAAELPDEEYPFVFTTGRVLYQYHTRTMTGKSEGLNNIMGNSFVEINPTDAGKLNIANSDKVNVASRRGEVTVEAHVTDKVAEGVLFMPFHYKDGPANKLTNNVIDPIAKIPEYKVCAAKIEKA